MDMLVNLYTLPEYREPEGVSIRRALAPDRERILTWVTDTFGKGWRGECAAALAACPGSCFIARKDGQCVGFSCYDATAKGYFGPIGVDESLRGLGVGRALLIRTLEAMREAGYGYAVIGWCDEAAGFDSRSVGAVPIPGSGPENTLYGRMIRFSVKRDEAE